MGLTMKSYSLFIQNSSLTGCPVFSFDKSGNSTCWVVEAVSCPGDAPDAAQEVNLEPPGSQGSGHLARLGGGTVSADNTHPASVSPAGPPGSHREAGGEQPGKGRVGRGGLGGGGGQGIALADAAGWLHNMVSCMSPHHSGQHFLL